MSKQTLALVSGLAMTFAVGMGVGFLLASDPSQPDLAKTADGPKSSLGFFADANARDREQGNTLLSSRIRELEGELADSKRDSAAVMRDEFAFFKKFGNQGLYLDGFYADESPKQPVKLNDAMAALLQLSEKERRATEDTITQAKNEMVALRDADTVVAKETPNNITYVIPPDPKGKAIKDEMTEALVQNLGPDRAAFLLDSNGFTAPMSTFGSFSEQSTNVQVDWTLQSGKTYYTWRVMNSENKSESSNENPSEWLPDYIKKFVPTTTP